MAKEKAKAKGKTVKPVYKARSGQVLATIWEKEIKKDKLKFTVFNTEIVKNYKDDDDEYQKTSNFSQQDLGDVVVCSQLSQAWIVNKRQELYEEKTDDAEEDEEDEEEDE